MYQSGADDEHTFEVDCAFAPERMKPLPDRALEGRVNAKGISFLDVATSAKTASGECRPWVGALLSVSEVKTSRELRIVNCTKDKKSTSIHFEETEPQ